MTRSPARLALGLAFVVALAACGPEPGKDAAAGNAAAAAGAQRQTLGEALGEAGDHARLVAALDAAGLTAALRGAGPYTLFAPSNAAFAALPGEAGSALLQPANRDRLTGLLRYHIVPGTVTAEDMRRAIARAPEGRAELATMAGATLTLSRDGEAILVSDAAGGSARLAGDGAVHANGVLYGIDAVLMPEAARD